PPRTWTRCGGGSGRPTRPTAAAAPGWGFRWSSGSWKPTAGGSPSRAFWARARRSPSPCPWAAAQSPDDPPAKETPPLRLTVRQAGAVVFLCFVFRRALRTAASGRGGVAFLGADQRVIGQAGDGHAAGGAGHDRVKADGGLVAVAGGQAGDLVGVAGLVGRKIDVDGAEIGRAHV